MAPVPRGTTGTVPASPSRVVPPVYSTRPPTDLTPANAPRGPFDARPGTYRPRYDPHYDRPWNGYRNGYYGAPYFYGSGSFFNDSYPTDSTTAPAVPGGPGSDDSFLTQPQQQPVASAPIPAPPPPVLHHPDTFYVIPGCYVGNLRPRQEQLPKGCDMSKMKEMPVR
jgi:hypothetical protein